MPGKRWCAAGWLTAVGCGVCRDIPKGDIVVPEIKALGVYSATVKLHPEVTATIKINVVPGK